MAFTKEKPSFTEEYANRVSKADFIKSHVEVYKTLSADELGAEWEKLQEKKEAKATEKKAEK